MPRPLPGWPWRAGLLIVALAATWVSHGTLLGQNAGVTLVVVLLALKTLELRARRDAFVVFFLGFFTLLTHFFYSQSLLTAAGILVALLEREASGQGQFLHTSLLESMIYMLDFQTSRYLIDGEVATQAGNFHPTSIPTGVYKARDGYMNIAVFGSKIWERFCHILGAPEWITDSTCCRQKRKLLPSASSSD